MKELDTRKLSRSVTSSIGAACATGGLGQATAPAAVRHTKNFRSRELPSLDARWKSHIEHHRQAPSYFIFKTLLRLLFFSRPSFKAAGF